MVKLVQQGMKATELCGEIGSVQSPRADKEVMEANKMLVEKKKLSRAEKDTLCTGALSTWNVSSPDEVGNVCMLALAY